MNRQEDAAQPTDEIRSLASRVEALERDLAEALSLNEVLRTREAQFRALVENISDVIFEIDRQGVVLYFSPAGKQIWGYEQEEVIGRNFMELIHPDDLDLLVKRFAELGAGMERPLSYRIRDRGGEYRWVRTRTRPRIENGVFAGASGTLIDITEQKQTEEALRDSEEKHRRIIEALSDAVLMRDRERILYANPAALRLFRADHPGDLIGKRYLDLVHPEDRALSAERVKRSFHEHWIAPPREHRILALDGQVVHVESTGMPIQHRGQTQVFGLFRDITGRRQAEEERERLQAQLFQSQKMESIGRLAGGVAHDFNNMLGVILGHVEMAAERVDPAAPIHGDLQEIRKAAVRSADLTRQLLAFARKQTVTPRVLDLNGTLSGMRQMLRRLIGEDIELVWRPGEDLWPVKLDPSQIDQILANLSVNARDAIAGVGQVTIETANVRFDEPPCIDHADFAPGEYVLLAVSDNGCGMVREVREKLFEPFFTTKEAGKGTGLGLATVYGIVRQNGGFIHVYSEPDQGTTFRIYLPRHRGKAEGAGTEGIPEPVVRGRETILLVEDELPLLELSRRMLEKLGYRVLPAGTPGEAISLAEGHAGEIHLLMTDVVMPEMNGRELARKVLSFYPQVKRLFMSGYTADIVAHHGVLETGVNFIQKPYSRQELASRVREALDGE
jgi:PAS domain S-box-containing protein